MGGFQIPASRILRNLSPRTALIMSTVIASTGLLIMALPLGFAGLCVGLAVAGIGSSIQHPRGSMLVTGSYGTASRRPLGICNFSGDLGKATCGWFGERLGVVRSVILTEAATALLIATTLATPLTPTLILLPLLGIVLNGTSSVLYGTVPDLSDDDTSRAFAVFYTSVIYFGGVAPILYGAVADHTSQIVGVLASATTAALIVPLVLMLQPHLRKTAATAFSPSPP